MNSLRSITLTARQVTPSGSARLLSVGKIFETLAACWLPQFQQSPSFDLTNAFASDAIDASHFVESSWLAIAKPNRSSITSRSRGAASEAPGDPFTQ